MGLAQVLRLSCFVCAPVLLLAGAACQSTMPSDRLLNGVSLPVPGEAFSVPGPERFSRENARETYRLSARSLIPIAFRLQPDIKSRFHRFKSEEARYDFFYTSRDSLTPRLTTTSRAGELRANGLVTRTRNNVVEFGVEKQFFDTTALDVSVGFRADAVDEALGSHPFVSANLRYPLWASREKLELTSEEIFWRNQVDDAQLSYIQAIRSQLQFTLFRFHETVDLRHNIRDATQWQRDLAALLERLDSAGGRDFSADRRRVQAEIATVSAEVRNRTGRYDVMLERLKAACGLSFYSNLELIDEPFNPFEGLGHEELFKLSIETDPEIATLRNAERNAEVQLDLARRGRWDIALLLNGISTLEGAGEHDGASEWSASVGLSVSAVDTRVTGSLMRQAEANIARFRQAIASRENEIFVDTFEPLIRIDTLSVSRDELIGNLPHYQADYERGLEEYFAGTLNIDDLLKRRDNLFDQEKEVSRLIFLGGANVAELCAATGKFFELLETPDEH